MQNLKCVVVGDGFVGKTALLMSYSRNQLPINYLPTVFDNYEVSLKIGGQVVTLGLWDTAGQKCYERLRILSYTGANVILICYDTSNHHSLDNVRTKWIYEIKHYCPNAPIVLVGTKLDLREPGPPELIFNKRQTSEAQGKEVAKEIKACSFHECSAVTQNGVKNVFDSVAQAALNPGKRRRPMKRCSIL